MNINNIKNVYITLTIISIVPFNLILARINYNSVLINNSIYNNNDQVETFRSYCEYIIEEFELELNKGNDTFIGKTFSDVLDMFSDRIEMIFPGTVWCGSGDDASNKNDLGYFDKTDKCCRDHDNCPDDLIAGMSMGRLKNNGIFTRSSCKCDGEFYKCLKDANTVISTGIGTTYFNILRPQCFANDYPIESCAKYDRNRVFDKKCLKYNLNTMKEMESDKILQWFDNPDY